ncbi:MarR family winged helix-turn-helix transcriptional regulator [Streptococcus sp. DD13]|uniref:MarR family winged helix-turn-helix transcriptional regulator n=1 Tax=Streptococcus sp. DD13 TaxID=1777881 RepID=UPI00079A5BB7|nr:MarR family winged helix-turn-helix transcriptional regulator [Streptococcus sp. DD13]KXT78601.1 Transcriptional regulator, MarR family [Streptococcus sp. DD13]
MISINDLLYQLHLADQASTRLFEKRLGISLTRYQMLQYLLSQGESSQIALKEILGIDQAALARHFKILEEEGYVTRQRNPLNQRESIVALTDFAREQLLTHPPLHHLSTKEQMESILTASESKELSRLLEKLVTGLEEVSPENRK